MKSVFNVGDSKFRSGADGLVQTVNNHLRLQVFATGDMSQTMPSIPMSLSSRLSGDGNSSAIPTMPALKSEVESSCTLIQLEP